MGLLLCGPPPLGIDDRTEVFQEIPLKLKEVHLCNIFKINNAKRVFKACHRYTKNTAVTETATPCFGDENLYV